MKTVSEKLNKNIKITTKELKNCSEDYINYTTLQNQVIIMEALLNLIEKK